MDATELGELEVKYASLLRLIEDPQGVERDRGLRELAARWPGVLREGQLAPLPVLRARAQAVTEIGAVRRGVWRERGQAAVPLWAELHRLLGDLARLRAGGPGPAAPDGGPAEATRSRWPTDPAWWSAQPWPPGARLPRSWLAAVCGASPLELDGMLRGSSEP